MSDADNILLNDRTGIKLRGNIVACSTYNLNTTLVSLMIRLCSYESRKEWVVDIDNLMRIALYHILWDNLHIAGKNDEWDTLLLQKLHLCLLHLLLVWPVFLYWPYIVRNAELICHVAKVLVIADDTWNLNIKFTCLITCKEVVEAMAHLTYEQSHARLHIVEVNVELHLISWTVQCLNILFNLLWRDGELGKLPLHTHEEAAVNLVHILVKVNNVTVIICNELGDICNNTQLIRAM